MKQKVVVIGHGYTSRLGVIRSLAALDCEIEVVIMTPYDRFNRFTHMNGGRQIDCHSKYVSRYYYALLEPEDDLIRLLLEKVKVPGQKVILVPDSDFSADLIDRNQERLKAWFLFPHIHHTPGQIGWWMDKSRQKELAVQVGLQVAAGQIVTVKDRQYDFPSGVVYPCFTKPLATINGGKQFLKKCADEQELRKVLDAIARRFRTDVLIEEFKEIGQEYAVVGVSDGQEVVIPGVIEFKVNSRSHFGIAREGMILPVDGFEDLLAKFREFVRRIGFVGMFDIDFYRSGGSLFFSELNLRFGGSGYAYTAMGANLPALYVKALLGGDIGAEPCAVTSAASYVNERMCLEDYLHGYLGRKEVKSILRRADISFVRDKQDPGPYRKMVREFPVLWFRKYRLQWKKKIRS